MTGPGPGPGPARPSSSRTSGLWTAHRHRALHLVRYSAVSVVATTTSLVTLGLLVGLAGTPSMWANVIATAVGTVPSFELNRRWVWRAGGPRSVLHQVAPFCALSATGLVVSTVAVGVASARTVSWGHGAHVVAVLAADVAAYGSLWVVQFVLLDRVLFRSGAVGHRGPGSDAPGDVSDLSCLVGAVSGSIAPGGPHRPGREW